MRGIGGIVREVRNGWHFFSRVGRKGPRIGCAGSSAIACRPGKRRRHRRDGPGLRDGHRDLAAIATTTTIATAGPGCSVGDGDAPPVARGLRQLHKDGGRRRVRGNHSASAAATWHEWLSDGRRHGLLDGWLGGLLDGLAGLLARREPGRERFVGDDPLLGNGRHRCVGRRERRGPPEGRGVRR